MVMADTAVDIAMISKAVELACRAPSLHNSQPTNKQIAARMFLAEKTVKNYVSRLLAKLGMERRTQAAVFASKLDQQRRPAD